MKIHISKSEELAYSIKDARIQLRRSVNVEISDSNALKAKADIARMLRRWETGKEKSRKLGRKM